MTFVVALGADELKNIEAKLEIEQKLTKALPSSIRPPEGTPQLTLVCERASDGSPTRLAWLGMVIRPNGNTVGAVDKAITIDPLRRCRDDVPLDGPEGLILHIPEAQRETFKRSLDSSTVTVLSLEIRTSIVDALLSRHVSLTGLVQWLLALADPSPLTDQSVEDRSWQEQQDSLGTLFRLADFPLSAIAAWRRPSDRDAPYLAGLVPEPVEHAFIEQDSRNVGQGFRAYLEDQIEDTRGFRLDIQVHFDENGRRLEVINVNATPVESRLGTDLIYFHEPTRSFVLVQVKRLAPDEKTLYVDQRLLNQMDRLDKVASLSLSPRMPEDWRLSSDPCFLKLTYWPSDRPNDPRQPAHGMYLPVSYVRMLLKDDSTRGPQGGRILGYGRVERYLITTQFAELVRNGLAGTVGTTIEQLRELVVERVKEGFSVTAGIEYSDESAGDRQKRTRARGPRKTRKVSVKSQSKPRPSSS